MARIYEGVVGVGYHLAEIHASNVLDGATIDACFAGQVNGLCGTEAPGTIMFITGIHHGEVSLTIDVLESEPPLDHSWEEIVEASFWNEGDAELQLVDFYGYLRHTFSLEPDEEYRVRLCGRGMDKAAELDTHVGPEPVDLYALTFWPAPLAADAILKQTSEFAAQEHQGVKNYKAEAG